MKAKVTNTNTIILLVVILSTITLSNYISKLIPGVSTSIVTTILGFLLGSLPVVRQNFPSLDNEVFLVVILAPLLFLDAQRTPMLRIHANFKRIINSSVILVVLSSMVVTLLAHYLFNLNFALALIIAAISTPTDATGFQAVVSNRHVDHTISSQLAQESLFNDASGLILLQAGLVWASTGNLAFTQTIFHFLTVAISGGLLGLLLGNLVIIIRQGLLRSNIKVYSSQTLLYFLTPILVYLIADLLHTSGIIAVVAAGLVHNSESNRSRFIASRQTVFILHSISFITETLNSVVFLILGIYLARFIMLPVMTSVHFSYWLLTGLFIYFILFTCRYIYSLRMTGWINRLIFSLGGVHGTVTLAMALTVSTPALSKSAIIGLLITEITIIILSLVVPSLIFRIILPLESVPITRQEKVRLIREQAVTVGLDTIQNRKVNAQLKTMVLYDLRDQNGNNSIFAFLKQYHRFGTDHDSLDDLRSHQRQSLMMQAFNAELDYLYQLRDQHPSDIIEIHEVYSEILYSEVLMLDPHRRLV